MRIQKSQAWTLYISEGDLSAKSESTQIRFRGVAAESMPTGLISGETVDSKAIHGNLLNELLDRKIVIPEPTGPAPSLRFSRQHDYFSTLGQNATLALEKLQSSRVLVAGVGALGSTAVQNLVGAGVKNFRLIDPDSVCPSNMNRQFTYTAADTGRTKVECLKMWILERNPEAHVETHAGTLRNFGFDNALHDMSFAVATFDKPNITEVVEFLEHAWKLEVPSIFGATGFMSSVVTPVFDPGASSASPSTRIKITSNGANREPIRASFGPISTYNAAVIAEQTIFHLAGVKDEVNHEVFQKTTRRGGVVHNTSTNGITF